MNRNEQYNLTRSIISNADPYTWLTGKPISVDLDRNFPNDHLKINWSGTFTGSSLTWLVPGDVNNALGSELKIQINGKPTFKVPTWTMDILTNIFQRQPANNKVITGSSSGGDWIKQWLIPFNVNTRQIGYQEYRSLLVIPDQASFTLNATGGTAALCTAGTSPAITASSAMLNIEQTQISAPVTDELGKPAPGHPAFPYMRRDIDYVELPIPQGQTGFRIGLDKRYEQSRVVIFAIKDGVLANDVIRTPKDSIRLEIGKSTPKSWRPDSLQRDNAQWYKFPVSSGNNMTGVHVVDFHAEGRLKELEGINENDSRDLALKVDVDAPGSDRRLIAVFDRYELARVG